MGTCYSKATTGTYLNSFESCRPENEISFNNEPFYTKARLWCGRQWVNWMIYVETFLPFWRENFFANPPTKSKLNNPQMLSSANEVFLSNRIFFIILLSVAFIHKRRRDDWSKRRWKRFHKKIKFNERGFDIYKKFQLPTIRSQWFTLNCVDGNSFSTHQDSFSRSKLIKKEKSISSFVS